MLNFYRLEQEIASQMQEAHVPGLALAIVQGQEVVYAKGFGVTSVEDGGIPVTPQTLFRIGSITKPLTGTAIMRMVEAGKLDLANFAIMHMQQGMFQGERILRPQSIQEMHKPQVSLYSLNDDAYGLTFFLETYKGLRQVRHDGGISTFGSRLAMLPDKQLAVIMTFNRWLPTVDAVTHAIFDKLLDLPTHRPEPKTIEPDRSLWTSYVGTYLADWHGLAKIEIVDDMLTLRRNESLIPLKALRQDLYIGLKADNEVPISVGFPVADSPIPYIYIDCFVYRRAELITHPDPTKWQSYEGTYALEGMDTYVIRLVENELRIFSEHDTSEIVLTPIDGTRFSSLWGIFEFLTDEHEHVSSVKQGPTWINASKKFDNITLKHFDNTLFIMI